MFLNFYFFLNPIKTERTVTGQFQLTRHVSQGPENQKASFIFQVELAASLSQMAASMLHANNPLGGSQSIWDLHDDPLFEEKYQKFQWYNLHNFIWPDLESEHQRAFSKEFFFY